MRALRMLAVTAAVAAAAVGLQAAGRGALAPPPLTDPSSWSEWLAGREPVEAALALVRLAALVVLWYLAVAAVVGTVARLARAEGLVAAADRLTVPALRRLLVATASVSLASGVGPAMIGGRGPAAAAVAVATDGPVSTTSTTVDGRTDPTLTMRLLPVEGVPAAPAQPAEAPAPAAARAQPAGTTTHTVVAGECFWSIAEDVLTRAWGRPPTDAEIVPYWRTLIEANRAVLADRANEDLIFPGQAFTVPSPPAPR